MDRLPCPECGKTFRKKTGLEWHLKRAHSETGRDRQRKRAYMAQEVIERPGPPLAEPPATPTEPTKPTEHKTEVRRYYVIA